MLRPKSIGWFVSAVLLFGAVSLVLAPRASASPAAFGVPVHLPAPPDFITSGAPVGAPYCAGPQLAYGGQQAQGLGFGWVPVTPSPAWPSYVAAPSPPGALGLVDSPVLRVAAVGNGFVYAWQGTTGYLTFAFRSADGTWGPVVPATPQAIGQSFDLATAGSSLFLGWVDSSPPNGTLRVAQVSATNWTLSSATIVDADASHGKDDVALAAAGSALDVVWRRSNVNGSEAYFARVTLGGPAPTPVQVTPGLGAIHQFVPVVVALPNGTALVAMTDYDGSTVPRLPAAYIASPYTAFGPAIDLGGRLGGHLADAPQFLVDSSGTLHLAWLSASLDSNGSYAADTNVMYAASEDGGATFSAALRVDRDPSVLSKNLAPLIEGTDGDLFIPWSGGSSSTPTIVRGVVPGVHAAFTIAPIAVFANESVTFNGSASTDGGTVTLYAWSFGDGGVSSGAQTTHLYASPGTFTVSLTVTDAAGRTRTTCLPLTVAPALTFTTITHPAGFRIDVPTSWQLQEDQTIAGQMFALVLTGASANGFRTNVLVRTEANANVRSDSAYLLASVQEALASVRQTNPSAYLDGSPQLRTLSGDPAVSFVIRYGTSGIVQKGALVVNTALQRDWVLLLSCDVSVYPWMNVTFEYMLSTFTITLVPPLLGPGLLLAVVVGAAVAAAAVLVVFVVVRRRKRKFPGTPASGAPSPASALVCANCGASLEPGARFCGACGAPGPGGPPQAPGPPPAP